MTALPKAKLTAGEYLAVERQAAFPNPRRGGDEVR